MILTLTRPYSLLNLHPPLILALTHLNLHLNPHPIPKRNPYRRHGPTTTPSQLSHATPAPLPSRDLPAAAPSQFWLSRLKEAASTTRLSGGVEERFEAWEVFRLRAHVAQDEGSVCHVLQCLNIDCFTVRPHHDVTGDSLVHMIHYSYERLLEMIMSYYNCAYKDFIALLPLAGCCVGSINDSSSLHGCCGVNARCDPQMRGADTNCFGKQSVEYVIAPRWIKPSKGTTKCFF